MWRRLVNLKKLIVFKLEYLKFCGLVFEIEHTFRWVVLEVLTCPLALDLTVPVFVVVF